MECQNFWQIECQNIRPIEVQIECKDIWRRISDCQNLWQIERQKIWESDSKSGNISGYMSRQGWWYRTLRPDIHYSSVFAPPFSFHTLPFSLLYRICGGDLTANGGTSTSWLSHGFLSFTSSAWTTLALSLRWSGGCSESFSRHSSFKVWLPPTACVFFALWLTVLNISSCHFWINWCFECFNASRRVATAEGGGFKWQKTL